VTHVKRRRTSKDVVQRPQAGAVPAQGDDPARKGDEPRPAGHPVPGARRGRRWAFRLIAAVLAPALALAMLEAVLWAAGYGVPTSFFRKIPGRDAYASNGQFGWRFFPPAMSRAPQLVSLPAVKPAGTYRIFVLGSSAAAGTPDPAVGFSRVLRAMLQQQYPAAKFEVVNTAMTAVNSHVMRAVARECADHNPDLVVVYMGNNEVIGPYGPGTVFAGYSPSLSLIRASIFLRTTRTGQFLARTLEGLGGGRAAGQWRGMEAMVGHRVPADDVRLEGVYEHFRANLTDICRFIRDAGAQVVLCTVGTNLRQCAPFASEHRQGLAEPDRQRFDSLCQAAAVLEAGGKPAEAAGQYAAAERIDDRFAELHYRLGRCQLAAGRAGEAREHFRLARDLDALRFRADTRINDVIRQVAGDQAGRGVHLVDFDKLLAGDVPADRPGEATSSPTGGVSGVSGSECFHEHVHLNFEGNWELAAAVYRQMGRLLPASIQPAGRAPEEPASARRCAELLAWTAWGRRSSALSLVDLAARPPFTGQCDHQADLARRRAEAANLRSGVTPETIARTEGLFLAAIGRDGDDLVLRDSFAEFLTAQGKYSQAAEQWQAVLRQVPDDASTIGNLGRALAEMGQLDQAIESYRKCLAVMPGQLTAMRNLAAALASKGDRTGAEACYRSALAGDPDSPRAHAGLATLLADRKEYDQAIEHLREAIRLGPDNPAMHEKLAVVLDHAGRAEEAAKQFDQASSLAGDDPAVHQSLGQRLLRTGRYEPALEQFGRVLRVRPNSAVALYGASQALDKLGRGDKALECLTRAVELAPGPQGHRELGLMLSRQDKSGEAIRQYRLALRLKPGWAPASGSLAWELATANEQALRSPAEAVALAEAACKETNYADYTLMDILAVALAADGQFDRAAAMAQKALGLARSAGQAQQADAIQARLGLYKARRPSFRG
jgi:tetratricopeptide (TPR) repeat protein